MISWLAIAVSGALFFAIPTHAQKADVKNKKAKIVKTAEPESPSSKPERTHSGLTWDECVREMAKSNVELRSFVTALRSSQELVKSARSGYFPQISGSISHSQSDSASSSATTSTSTGSGSNVSTSLNLTQNLFNGFSDVEKVEAAKRQVVIAENNLQAAKARALLELRTAYVNYVHAKKMIELGEYIIRRRDDNLKMVELRFESGRENKGAVLLSRAYLEQAKFEKMQSTNGQRLASEQLAKVLGREVGESVEVSSELRADSIGAEPAIEKLAQQVPEYQISKTQEEIALIALRQSRSAFYPTLNLTGSVFATVAELQNQNNHWSFGVTLNIPLFNGGRDYFSNSSAAYNLQTATYSQQTVARQTIVKLRQNYMAWLEAYEQSRINQSYLSAHKVRATISRDKYNNGLLTFDQWDTVENDLIKIEKDYLAGLKTRWVAEATWKQVQGLSEPALDEALR